MNMLKVTVVIIAAIAVAWSSYLGYTEFYQNKRGKICDRNNDSRRNGIETTLAVVIAVIGLFAWSEEAIDMAFGNLPADTSAGWIPIILVFQFFYTAGILAVVFMAIDWVAGTIHLGMFKRAKFDQRKKQAREEQERRKREQEEQQLQESRFWRTLFKLTETRNY